MSIPRAKFIILLSTDVVHLGFAEQQLRTIRENVTTLKFTANKLEAE